MSKVLNEQREEKALRMQELLDSAKAETRALSEEEINEFDTLEREIKNIDETLQREEKTKMNEEVKVVETQSVEEREIAQFADYIRSQVRGMEFRSAENMTKGNNGDIIPHTIVNKIIEKVNAMCPIYARATKYTVKGTLQIPTEDTSNDSITVAYGTEFSELTGHANRFDSIDLTGFVFGALTKMSKSLIQNTDIDLVNWVVGKMSRKIARFIEGELLNGTADKVAGIAGSYDSTNNKVTLADKSAVTLDEIITLMGKVPDAVAGDAIFVMAPATREYILKLKDGENRYLMNYDPTAAFGYKLFGHDVYCSDNVTALGSTTKNVIFYGNPECLAVKEPASVEIQILREFYATQHAIGVVAWGEIDAKVENKQGWAVAATPAS